MKKSKLDKALQRIYLNPKDSGSYGGVERLLQSALNKKLKVNRERVVKFLKTQDPYTLHKPARKHFSRNITVVGGIDQQWQADLADLQDLTKENDGYRYLLTVIDCFSKFAWAIPTKKKRY